MLSLWPLLRTDVARTENHSPLRNWITTLPPSERLLLHVKLWVVHLLLLIVKVAERRASFFFRSISRFSSTAAEMNLLGEMRNTHGREGKKNNKNLKHSFSFSSRHLRGCLPLFLLSFSGSSHLSLFSQSLQTTLLPALRVYGFVITCFFFSFRQIVTM